MKRTSSSRRSSEKRLGLRVRARLGSFRTDEDNQTIAAGCEAVIPVHAGEWPDGRDSSAFRGAESFGTKAAWLHGDFGSFHATGEIGAGSARSESRERGGVDARTAERGVGEFAEDVWERIEPVVSCEPGVGGRVASEGWERRF